MRESGQTAAIDINGPVRWKEKCKDCRRRHRLSNLLR